MISVIIPVREGGNAYQTLRSIANQTLQPDEILVQWDEGKGANWARNRGFERSRGDLLIFSDDDIAWEPDAFLMLHNALTKYKGATFSYGTYLLEGKAHCSHTFTADRLRENSCVSTMSMIRRAAFPGFDEQLRRLQDWDLFLTMLKNGQAVGVHCGGIIFTTAKRDGITHGPGAQDWREARDIVARKHGI